MDDTSTIARLADVTVVLPGVSPKLRTATAITSIQPMGSAFEQISFLTYDAIILELMDVRHESTDTMFPPARRPRVTTPPPRDTPRGGTGPDQAQPPMTDRLALPPTGPKGPAARHRAGWDHADQRPPLLATATATAEGRLA